MIKLQFDIDETSPCFYCHESFSVLADICPNCKQKALARVDLKEFLGAYFAGQIIDARLGGYVIGRKSEDEDVYMVQIVADGIFQVIGAMQGGEYIVSQAAAAKHGKRLEEINSFARTNPYTSLSSIAISKNTRVFNTHGMNGYHILLVDNRQFIVNRAATAKFFSEIEELNNSVFPD